MYIQIARLAMVLVGAVLGYGLIAYHPEYVFPGLALVVILMAAVDYWRDRKTSR